MEFGNKNELDTPQSLETFEKREIVYSHDCNLEEDHYLNSLHQAKILLEAELKSKNIDLGEYERGNIKKVKRAEQWQRKKARRTVYQTAGVRCCEITPRRPALFFTSALRS